MGKQADLNQELCDLLGSAYVYFDPPENIQMQFPCIIYTREGADVKHANDRVYMFTRRYTVTYVSFDSSEGVSEYDDKEIEDSQTVVERIINHFPLCKYDRHFCVDGLSHDVFELYY